MVSRAHGLFVATEGTGNAGDTFAASGGQEDLAATEHKGIGRAQTGFDPLLFFLGEWAHKDGLSHVCQYTTFPITCLEIALVH